MELFGAKNQRISFESWHSIAKKSRTGAEISNRVFLEVPAPRFRPVPDFQLILEVPGAFTILESRS